MESDSENWVRSHHMHPDVIHVLDQSQPFVHPAAIQTSLELAALADQCILLATMKESLSLRMPR